MKSPFISKTTIVLLMIINLHFIVANAQTQEPVAAHSDTSISPIVQRIENLEYRMNLESLNSENRYKDFRDMISLFSIIFGILIAIITLGNFFSNLFREQQQRKDYLAERKFYEDRVLNIEDRDKQSAQQQRKDYSAERKFYEDRVLNREDRDMQSAQQQLSLGSTVLTHSSEILSQQIENINKLGGVINLVRGAFDLQLKREKEQSKLAKKFDETNKVVDQFIKDFQTKFDEAAGLIIQNFENYKAMDWPAITDEALNLSAKGRNKFEEIPSFILDEERKKRPHYLAWVFQLMGTSAFYANDIASAFLLLKKADDIFNSSLSREEDGMKRAYTKFFLGIAEKNWQQETGVVRSNLNAALNYLELANELVKEEKKQFLIPITLAEVKSYLTEKRSEAATLIGNILNRFEAMDAQSLDPNQRALLMRTYLLKGNIEFKSDPAKARDSYEKAFSLNEKNPYAHLSYAHTFQSEATEDRDRHWTIGMECLIRSGALHKKEITTKVMALVWATVAAKKCSDITMSQRYQSEFEAVANNLHSVAQRIPLFFSPFSKDILAISELRRELNQYLLIK
jgi:hypothetical protein